MKKGIYPGSFDPITNGHLDVIERASRVCDELLVAVLSNPSKKSLFTFEERVELIEQVIKPFSNVRVVSFSGLLVDFARAEQANALVKGLRTVSDFEYEFQMAMMNSNLAAEIETIFLMARSKHAYISSSLVKEVAAFQGRIDELVPEIVKKAIEAKY